MGRRNETWRAVLPMAFGLLMAGNSPAATDAENPKPARAVTAENEPVQLTARQRSAESSALRKVDKARQFMGSGYLRKARDTYLAAAKSLELNFGANDLRLVTPLRGVARTYELQRSKPKETVKVLQRIVQIHEIHRHDVSENDRLNAYLQLGDAGVMARRESISGEAYVKAWQILVDQSSAEKANEFFASPEAIEFRPPSFNPISETPDNVIVAVNLVIDTGGRARQVDMVKVPDPATKMARDIKRAVSKGLFRPMVIDGVLADSGPMRLRLAYPRAGGQPLIGW